MQIMLQTHSANWQLNGCIRFMQRNHFYAMENSVSFDKNKMKNYFYKISL